MMLRCRGEQMGTNLAAVGSRESEWAVLGLFSVLSLICRHIGCEGYDVPDALFPRHRRVEITRSINV